MHNVVEEVTMGVGKMMQGLYGVLKLVILIMLDTYKRVGPWRVG